MRSLCTIASKRWRWICRAAVLLALIPVVAAAQTPSIEIETEDYTAFHDVGGTLMQKVILSGCSGGYILIGLDSPGEWAQYNVSPLAYGYYSFVLTARGDYGVEYGFRLTFTPTGPGTAQTVEFSFTGQGYG
jgi:hypothetical protein